MPSTGYIIFFMHHYAYLQTDTYPTKTLLEIAYTMYS